MKDVARAAGVSHMTVSRVVNGEVGVLPDKVSRVERAIRKLGYQRNDMARQLRRQGQTTGTIGLVVDDVANTFWSALARAVEDVAMRQGFLVLVGSTNDDRRREQEVVSAFCARRVDGLVVVPVAGSQRFLRTQMAMGTRVVCVDRPADGLEVDTVVVDNRSGARDAIAHLIGQGHERIGFLGDREEIWTAEERYAGYLDALGDTRIEPKPTYVRRGVRTAAQATAAARELTTSRRPPTAIFTGNNVITIGALAAFSQDDRPRTTALVGFDDFPLADRLAPPVTVVQQDPAALGATAAQMLLARIEGDEAPARTVVLKTRLLPRGSGEIPPP